MADTQIPIKLIRRILPIHDDKRLKPQSGSLDIPGEIQRREACRQEIIHIPGLPVLEPESAERRATDEFCGSQWRVVKIIQQSASLILEVFDRAAVVRNGFF